MQNTRIFIILLISIFQSHFILANETELKAMYEKCRRAVEKNSDSSIYYAENCIKLSSKKKNTFYLSRGYAMLGEIYQKQSKFKESIEYYLFGIQLAEKTDDKAALSSSYNGIGITYYLKGELSKAEIYIKKAMNLKLALKDYTYYSIITTNLAGIYFYQKKFDKAVVLLKNAEKVIKGAKKEKYLASLYNSLGGIYAYEKNELDSASNYYLKALTISQTYSMIDIESSVLHNLGELALRKGDFQQAISYLKTGVEFCKKNDQKVVLISIYSTLGDAYVKINDFENAYKSKSAQLEIRNTVFESEKQKAVSELEIKYETAKREREIQQKKQDLERANLTIEKSKNKFNVILFLVIILLLIFAFVIFYFKNISKNQRIIEIEKAKMIENIVHDIRTPLTLINGPMHLLKAEINSPKFSEYAEVIELNSNKLINLVNELLDASKLQKGKFELSYIVGNPALIANKIINQYNLETERSNCVINFENLIPASCNVYFAGNVFEKSFQNILENAVKFAPTKSTISIRLSLKSDCISFLIQDQGPGIPASEQNAVFDRFYRLKRDKNRPGTGIGLSIVRESVELAEGAIKIIHSSEKGTTFECEIPFKAAIQQSNSTIINTDVNPTLLVIEDDLSIFHFLETFLGNEWNLISATNGEDGIQLINQELPDLILSDVMLPGISGLEVTSMCKQNPLTNHIPLVLFSAKSSEESRIEGLTKGADSYVAKPFNPGELKLILQNLRATTKNNQREFLENLKAEKRFEERIHSTNTFVNSCVSFITKHLNDENYSISDLASDMAVSRSQLHRKLIALTGLSASNFFNMVRIEFSKDLLRKKELTITEIAYQCGFNSQSYFTKTFTEYTGESPSKFLENFNQKG